MKKTVQWFIIASVLVPATLGTMSLVAPPTPADRQQLRLFCGGKPGGNGCPEGFVCVDFRGDKCDPLHASDCIGVCRKRRA